MDEKRWTWKQIDIPERVRQPLAERFLTGIYETALEIQPQNLEVLVALGNLYTRAGLFQKGLEVDRLLVSLRPEEPTFQYNLACSQSLLGDLDAAFRTLERAIELGYDEFEHLLRDPDLANLRRDRRWTGLLDRLRESEHAE